MHNLHFSLQLLSSGSSASPCERNTVGELQNLAARKRWELPTYEYGEPTGEAHSKTFTCLVRVVKLECFEVIFSCSPETNFNIFTIKNNLSSVKALKLVNF